MIEFVFGGGEAEARCPIQDRSDDPGRDKSERQQAVVAFVFAFTAGDCRYVFRRGSASDRYPLGTQQGVSPVVARPPVSRNCCPRHFGVIAFW